MSTVGPSEFRQAYLDPKIGLYTLLLHERTRDTLRQITEDVGFPGATDPSALSFLATYIRMRQPASVLELGTHIGLSTVVLADVLSGNARPARLITVDPAQDTMAKAQAFVRRAGLEASVEFISGRSIDGGVVARLEKVGPFELIYVDSSHSYRETLEELQTLWNSPQLTSSATCMCFHDAGRDAAAYDPRGEGGVRRALDEWMSAAPSRYQLMVFEPPLWPNPTGLGIMRRVEAEASG